MNAVVFQHETTVYIDGAFEYQKIVSGGNTEENNTLHVMDDTRRIAMVRVGTAFTGDSAPPVKFILEDHIGSSAVVVSDAGSWVNREEFSAFGETLVGSFARSKGDHTNRSLMGSLNPICDSHSSSRVNTI